MAGTAARGPSSVRPAVLAAAALAAFLLALQLLVPPVVGLANNGDFERVLGPAGLRSTAVGRAEQYFSWIVLRFEDAPRGWYATRLMTSEVLLARAARFASRPFSPAGLFDLRWLGALHAALLVAGLALLVSATAPLVPAARWTAAAFLVFVFTDVGYAAPLNSFYSQAASLVFLMLVLGVLARAIPDPGLTVFRAIAFAALAVLFVGSKPQEALQGFLLSAYAVRLGQRNGATHFWMRPSVWAAAAVSGFSVWYLVQTPPEIADVARYHKVFMELLPSSPDPAGDLRDLGLDPSWTAAIGKVAYPPSSPFQDPAFRSEFLRRFRYTRLLEFYATHPSRLRDTVLGGGEAALTLRHPRFGNFEHRAGFPAGARTSSFAVWSNARRSLPGHPLLWIGLLWIGNLTAVAAAYRKAGPEGRLALEGIVLLVLMAALAFFVCVLSNAHGDLARHFYVFHALTDLLLVADAVGIAAALAARRAPVAASN